MLSTILVLYSMLMPTMDCTSEVVCMKQTASQVEGKIDWDIIDLGNYDRLEFTWTDENTAFNKLTHADGKIETWVMRR
jgi:hypothetical protein